MEKRVASYRLTEQGLEMLARMAREHGIGKTAVLEMLIREGRLIQQNDRTVWLTLN